MRKLSWWALGSVAFFVLAGPALAQTPAIVIPVNAPGPNLSLELGCPTTTLVGGTTPGTESSCPFGTGTINIRNTGTSVARNVTITVPYPAEADRNAHAIRTGVNTTCKRDGKKKNSSLVCQLGDLAPGGLIAVRMAYAPKSRVYSWSPVLVTVTTSDPEPNTTNNQISFQPVGVPPTTPLYIHCDKACQKSRCLEHLAKQGSTSNSLAALIGQNKSCEKQPKWMTYVTAGIFAVGAIVTGVGVLALAQFGATETLVFTAIEAGGFIR